MRLLHLNESACVGPVSARVKCARKLSGVSGKGGWRVSAVAADVDGWTTASISFTLLSQRPGYSSVRVAVVISLV